MTVILTAHNYLSQFDMPCTLCQAVVVLLYIFSIIMQKIMIIILLPGLQSALLVSAVCFVECVHVKYYNSC